MIKEQSLHLIRNKHSIGDYLASKDIHPVRCLGDRTSYVCPIHKDTKPSFIVYAANDESENENYFCFGCKRSGCIISLKAAMEDLTWGESISVLGKDVNITESSEIEFLVKALKKQINGEDSEETGEIGRLSLNISSMGFLYSQKIKRDEKEEIDFLEKLYKKVDYLVKSEDLEGMIQLYDFVSDRRINGLTPFEYRYKMWEEKKLKEMQECARAYGNI
ncbi:MAG: hypothetical protein HOG49_29975 [Candidatus Scalindua sp.]|nr:hypothetical protein [Candidatus Scalindua sp.]